MKRLLGKITGIAILAACMLIVIILLAFSGGSGSMTTCTGMSVEFFPQDLGLCDAQGIKDLVTDRYGVFIGQRADSVGLDRIEKILDSEGYVRKSQVYITPDGMLHARIEERRPEISFVADQSVWYADRSGKVFRAPGAFNGEVPVAVGRPFEGESGWVKGMLDVAAYVVASQKRGISFSGIGILPDGAVTLGAADGNEKFLLGSPSPSLDAAFRRIDRYYRDIRGEEKYRTVDVRYKGQIICKK